MPISQKQGQKTKAAPTGESKVLDLLSYDPAEHAAAAPHQDGEKLYEIEAGGGVFSLSVDELIVLAQKCLAAQELGIDIDGAAASVPTEFAEFRRLYPEVMSFPQEVADRISKGATPVEAYRAFETEELRKKLRAYEQNETNQKTSPGSALGQAGADGQFDELMAIYNSIFK